jgi:hypothetical protein
MDTEKEAPSDDLEGVEDVDEEQIGDGIKSVGCTLTLSPS